MATFFDADENYRKAIEAIGGELPRALNAARSVGRVNFEGDDITRAALGRLKAFYSAQLAIKDCLGKGYGAAAADIFVETVAFYLKVAADVMELPLTVAAEKPITTKRGSMRPDISVWSGARVIAAIECKTQLGWDRHGWLSQFETRQAMLSEHHPSSKLFLLVMTGSNWGGFGDDARVGKQFFVLLGTLWPISINVLDTPIADVRHRLEMLLEAVLFPTRMPFTGSD